MENYWMIQEWKNTYRGGPRAGKNTNIEEADNKLNIPSMIFWFLLVVRMFLVWN
jgi:hypothetical protein